MTIFIKQVLLGTCTGISFVDSTPLRVCRNQRILVHKTFEGLATRGKCSMGWFFGFKLHLVINDKGEILNFMFSPANVDDREPLKQGNFQRDIKGKLCADKGYIGQALFENLFLNGIQLLTRVKNNMRNSLMSVEDKILLRKRALIETVNDELKNIAQIEHSRHRSFNNFIANALSAIAAYCFLKRSLPLMSILSRTGNLCCFKLFRTHVNLTVSSNVDISQIHEGYKSKYPDVLLRALGKVRGLLVRKEKKVYLDLNQLDSRKNFVKLHEVGHDVLPWQQKCFDVLDDDDESLNFDTHEEFEAEANFSLQLPCFSMIDLHQQSTSIL